MADDHSPPPPPPQQALDIETDEGLSAYLEDLYARKGVPERFQYPETPEAYDRMIREAEAGNRSVPWDKVEAWMRSWGTEHELPKPEPE